MITKTETNHEYSDDDVTGANLIKSLQTPGCYKITLETKTAPSVEFIQQMALFGFTRANVISPQLDEDRFVSTFTNPNNI